MFDNKKFFLYYTLILIQITCSKINLYPDISEDSLPNLIQMTKNTDIRVAITFYYPSCPHCKFAEPVIQQMAEEFLEEQRKIGFFKVDCLKYPNLVTKYNIMSFPTIQIFQNGVFEKNVPQGFTEAPPLLKQWFLQIDSKDGLIQFAQLTKYQIHRKEIEFKRNLGSDFLPKVDDKKSFVQLAFKEIFDSNEHNYYPKDQDLVEAFFGQLIILNMLFKCKSSEKFSINYLNLEKKYVFPQQKLKKKQQVKLFQKRKSLSKIEMYIKEEQKKQKVLSRLKKIKSEILQLQHERSLMKSKMIYQNQKNLKLLQVIKMIKEIFQMDEAKYSKTKNQLDKVKYFFQKNLHKKTTQNIRRLTQKMIKYKEKNILDQERNRYYKKKKSKIQIKKII